MSRLLRRAGFMVLALAALVLGLYSVIGLGIAVLNAARGGWQAGSDNAAVTRLFFAVSVPGLMIAAGCGWLARRLRPRRD